MGVKIELDNMECNVLFQNLVQMTLEHPVSLVLNHPVILGWQVSGWGNECYGCTGTNIVPIWPIIGSTMLVAQVYVKLTRSSNRIKQVQHISAYKWQLYENRVIWSM